MKITKNQTNFGRTKKRQIQTGSIQLLRSGSPRGKKKLILLIFKTVLGWVEFDFSNSLREGGEKKKKKF